MARSVTRMLTTTALAIGATLTLAGPAQAHPQVNVICEGVSNSRFMCTAFISGAHEPPQIRWFINGVHIPELDGATHFVRGCANGTRVTGRAVVTDIHGSGQDSDSAPCGFPE